MRRLSFLILATALCGASFLYSASYSRFPALPYSNLASLNDDYKHVIAEHERRKQKEEKQKQEKEEREKKEKEEREKKEKKEQEKKRHGWKTDVFR